MTTEYEIVATATRPVALFSRHYQRGDTVTLQLGDTDRGIVEGITDVFAGSDALADVRVDHRTITDWAPLPDPEPDPPVLASWGVEDMLMLSSNGDAPWTPNGDELTVTLRPVTAKPPPAASDTLEDHYVLPHPVTRALFTFDIKLDAAMLDARTWKFGGLVAFDGDWSRWPGGSTSHNAGPNNAMVRVTGWHWDRKPDTECFGLYATFPEPVGPATDGDAEVAGAVAYVSNKGHTCHWLTGIRPKAGQWHEIEVLVRPEATELYVDNLIALELGGLPWPAAGFNRWYTSAMIGGNSPDDLPRTPTRTGTMRYRGITVHDLGSN